MIFSKEEFADLHLLVYLTTKQQKNLRADSPPRSFPLRSGVPLKPARGSGERCKLVQRGPGRSGNEVGALQSCEKATGGNHS